MFFVFHILYFPISSYSSAGQGEFPQKPEQLNIYRRKTD